jgi:hypothetical protein
MMTDRTAEAVTLARDTAALAGEIGALTGAVAEWADDALAGRRASPTWILHQVITANLAIAAAARGEAVTL